MSIEAYNVPEIAQMVGVSTVAVLARIKRNAMPEGVVCQQVGRNWIIYLPQGQRITRSVKGAATTAQRPGRNSVWVLGGGSD
jgi:hypothetical protein